MSKNRDFKGIWIPREIYLNEEMNWTEKILLVEIDSLDNEEGCYASNQYFADFLGKSKNWVSQCISKLKELEYIYEEDFDGRKRILRSNLTYAKQNTSRSKAGFEKNQRGGLTKVKGSLNEKSKGGKSKTTEESKDDSPKKGSNNTFNNKDDYISSCAAETPKQHKKEKKRESPPYGKIIQTLNQEADRNFSPETENTKKLIDQLYHAGYELENIVEVIKKKVEEWKETQYSKYLRPKTLFKIENFESYLNEPFNSDSNDGKKEKLTNIEFLEKRDWNQ